MSVADRSLSVAATIRRDPVGASRYMFDFDPWSMQRRIIRSVWRYPRTAVRSGNGVGKTAITFGVIGPAFLLAHPDSIVVTTAPTWRQVKQLGWREWRRSWGVMRTRMLNTPGVREVPIPPCLSTSVELDQQWHAFGMSTNEPEAFAGIHARRVLLIVDEASGVEEKIYEAGEGFLTGTGARALLIGNPTQPAGQFYRAFTSERASWNTLHINGLLSPNFTDERHTMSRDVLEQLVQPSWVEDKLNRWGEDSPLYQVRVLGNFPDQTDDTIISLVSVETAQQRSWEDEGGEPLRYPTIVISCDVARFGSDETVLMRRRGNTCEMLEVYHGRDTMVTAGKIVGYARAALGEQAIQRVRIVVDDDGIGGGVTDRLRETLQDELATDRADLIAYRGGSAPIRPERFTNKRTESWFRAKWTMDNLDIPNDDDLAADLVSVTYKMTSAGQLQAERKEDVKKRLGRSPDRGDALVMLLEPERKSAIINPGVIEGVDPDEASAYDVDW
jgi:phage terminase large subunit